MTRNAQAIIEVADMIEKYPQRYNQGDWGTDADCGTAYCIAGWRTILDGANWDSERAWFVDASGQSVVVAGNAQKSLGLDDMEANLLFGASWKPAEGLSPAQALRRFAEGASLLGVTEKETRDTWVSYYSGFPLVQEYLAEMKAHA